MSLSDYLNQQNEPKLEIDDSTKNYMLQCAKWSKFLSIVGFVFLALGGIIVFFALLVNAYDFSKAFSSNVLPIWFWFIYISFLIACFVVGFYVTLAMFKFATSLKIAVQHNDSDHLNDSFRNLKNYFKVNGVFVIIFLSIYALMLIIGVVVALSSL